MNNLLAQDIKDSFFKNEGNINTFTDTKGIGEIVTLFVNGSLRLAGVILLFFIVLGGIGIIKAAGEDDPQAAAQAKKATTSAVIGFIVVFVSYWIVQLIGTIVGLDNII